MRRQSGQRYRGLRAHHQRLKTQMTTLQQELAACKEEAERLRRAMEYVEVQKQESSDRSQPRPLNYTDLNSGEVNSVLTPGGMGRVTGYRLKFDPTDPEQGIFFMPAGESTSGQAAVIAKNGPSELIFLVPATLTKDDYTLEIRSTMGNGTVRTGVLADTLTVGY